MTHLPPPPRPPISQENKVCPPVVESSALLDGGRELIIRHAGHSYRLLLTSQNKLLLTK